MGIELGSFSLVVVFPVDSGVVWSVHNRCDAVLAEVVPSPGNEGVDFVPGTAEQPCGYAKPGCECHGALNLVPVRPHFRDGGVAADHRHDALVLVAEIGAFLAGDLVKNVSGSPAARLLSD